MTKEILKDEILKEEKLDQVAGGMFVPPALQKQIYPPRMQSDKTSSLQKIPY